MNLEVLHVTECPNLTAMLQGLRQATDLPVTTREITTAADASAFGMAGSPTLLINGADPFTTANHAVGALACRLYRDENDHPVAVPSVAQLRDAIALVAAAGPTDEPGDLLSAWRALAMPLDPVERAVHQLILRHIATTAHPPTTADLTATIAGSGRTIEEVLAALHELDTIRLGAAGRIEVAYPFSAHPTRHRVHIATGTPAGTDVYAMCAIDALGIAPMLNADTHIDSTDHTTGQPVRITTTARQTRWEPDGAVVFLGATAGGGPSADNCCDHLNFFTDAAAAKAWTTAHPHVQGQVLNQEQAETLAARLFGALLRSGSAPADPSCRGLS
ncbi:MAG TPA: alkylmercury lyase family protein, partial [Pseudonocardia sp.]